MAETKGNEGPSILRSGPGAGVVRVPVEVAVIAERFERTALSLETVVGPNLVTIDSSLASIAGSLSDLVEELKQIRRAAASALGIGSLTNTHVEGGH